MRCALCSLPIRTKIGTLTQWIFRTSSCSCLTYQPEEVQPATADLPSDDLIEGAPYHFIGVTGSGGAATVYKATHQKMKRTVAIKILHAGLTDDKSVQNFDREAKSASKLHHPNVVSVQDFGVMKDGRQFLVTEWIEGLTLAQYLATKGRLTVDVARELFSQVLDGLAHAHNRNVVHRDIKPNNLMLTRGSGGGWTVKIIDFGTAKEIDRDGSTTRAEDLQCSPFYMSPEHATNELVDHRSDLYSLGCSLFEALTGRPPFIGKALSVVMRHQTDTPPSLQLAAGGEEFPQSIETVVQKLLHKDPANRYQSADEVKQALNDPAAHQSEAANSRDDRRFSKPGKTNLPVVVFVATAVGLVAYLLILFISQLTQKPVTSHPHPQESPVTLQKLSDTSADDAWRESAESPSHFLRDTALEKLPVEKVKWLRLEGARSAEDKQTLARFEKLESLNLNHQALTEADLKLFTKLTNIWQLALINCSVPQGSLRLLRDMPNLTSLTLRECHLTKQDVIDVARLKLSYLTLSYNKAAGDMEAISAVCQMNSLVFLNVANCKIPEQALSKIAQLPNLQSLDLEGTTLSPQSFAAPWKKLELLDISYSHATDALIEQIALHTNLNTLEATANEGITDKSIPYLLQMKSLISVDLSGSQITEAGAALLRKSRPKLNAKFSFDSDGIGDLWSGAESQ